jgi:hypothetical protein
MYTTVNGTKDFDRTGTSILTTFLELNILVILYSIILFEEHFLYSLNYKMQLILKTKNIALSITNHNLIKSTILVDTILNAQFFYAS